LCEVNVFGITVKYKMFNSNLTSSITGWFSNTFQNKEEGNLEIPETNKDEEINKFEQDKSEVSCDVIQAFP